MMSIATNSLATTPIATTPKPPYYAVIFSSVRAATTVTDLNHDAIDAKNDDNKDNDNSSDNSDNDDGYATMAERMVALAQQQVGFLGVESAREALGITVSYWQDLDAIKLWQQNIEHLAAQQQGKDKWYAAFKVRIAKVERDYEFTSL